MGQFSKLNVNLSSDFVESILLDNRGIKWVGTDEGLNLITHSNNYSFYSNISNKTGILNSEVHKIKELDNNYVAIFSNSGISFFNPKTFSFKQLELKSKPIDLYFDTATKKYWVTTVSSGIYILNKSRDIEKNLLYDPLNPLTLSSSNFDLNNSNKLVDFFDESSVYIGTPNGFNIFDKSQKNIRRYFKQRSSALLSNKINAILRISEKELLVATDNGINFFNTRSKKFNKDVISSGKNISHLFNIDGDEYCFISEDKLYTFNLRNVNATLEMAPALDLNIEDQNLNIIKKDNILYVYAKGSNRLIFVDLKDFTKSNYDFKSNIQTLSLSNEQSYVGTNQGIYEMSNSLNFIENKKINGVYFYNNYSQNELFVYKNEIVINKKKIKVPFQTEINTQTQFEFFDGLLFFGGENLTIFDTNNYFFYKNIFSSEDILEGRIDNLKVINSKLYISTGNGIVTYSIPKTGDIFSIENLLDSQTKFKYNPLVSSDVPKSFSDIQYINDYLWVGTRTEGLKVFKSDFNYYIKDFKYEVNNKKSLATSYITKLFHDQNSKLLYIASKGDGLFRFDLNDSIFSNLTVNDGLLSNNVFDFMLKDKTIWVQTGNGINSINEDKDVRNINTDDGINIRLFHNEAIHDLGENILLSGFDDFQLLNPSKIYSSQIENFDLNILNVIGYDNENSFKFLEIDDKNNINIDNNINSIEINLLTNSKIKPEQIKYYLSSSLYDDILFNGYNNKINLKSIPFYSSKYEIYAVNGSGVKSNNTIEISVYNAPPWWLRIETIVGYVILLIGFVSFFVKYREKKTKERMEGERKSAELEEAKELQNSLLPKVLPQIDGFDISTYLKPATEIGGDYYDFFYKKGEYFYAICGDATGHGVISGIMVSVTKAGLHGVPMGDPTKILGQLNRIVKRVNFGRLRMSLSVAKFNKSAVELSSAAMPPTYFFSSKSKKVEEVLVPNLPLGGIETEKFDGVKKEFKSGDVMVMISDGLPELPNPTNDLLDYEKVQKCIKDNAEKSADEIKEALVYLSDEWASGVMNPDDITIVVIKKAA